MKIIANFQTVVCIFEWLIRLHNINFVERLFKICIDNFSFYKLADMHLVYSAVSCNGRETTHLCQQRYLERPQPHHSIHCHLRETATF